MQAAAVQAVAGDRRKRADLNGFFYFAYELIKTRNKIDVNSCQKPTAWKEGDTIADE